MLRCFNLVLKKFNTVLCLNGTHFRVFKFTTHFLNFNMYAPDFCEFLCEFFMHW